MKTKLLLCMGLLLNVSNVYATGGRAVVSLDTMELDQNGVLHYTYNVSGGCAKHTTEAKMLLTTETKGGKTLVKSAQLELADVTDQLDECEAMIGMSGTVNVQKLLTKELNAIGMPGRSVRVMMPAMQMQGQ